MTLEHGYENFIRDKMLRDLSDRTIEAYRDIIEPFIAYVGGSMEAEKLTTENIKDYIAHLQKRKLAKASLATYIRHIKVFLNWLSEETSVSFQVHKIPMPRVPKKNVHVYSTDEVREIFATIHATPEWIALRNRAAIALMLDSGLRRHEVCTAETAKLDTEAGLLTIIGKGEKERTVPIGRLSRRFISEYRSACPYDTSKTLLVGRYGEPFTDNALKQLVAKLAAKLPFEFSCHKLRHNFATNFCLDMYEEKGHMDAYSLQIILGHAEIQTTMRYIHHAQQIVASRAHISHMDKLFGV